jgi:cell division protein FtsB
MSTTGSTDNKPAVQGGGLQKIDRQAALAALRQPAGDVVEMHELAPVMASFREHLAAEQARNRRRLRALVTVFLVALCVLIAVPVYLARMYAQTSEAQLKSQQEAQEKMTKSLEDSMAALAAKSEQLQAELEKELAQERAMISAAATSAPPVAPTVIVVTTVVPVSVSAPVPVTMNQQPFAPVQNSQIFIPPVARSIGTPVQPFDSGAFAKSGQPLPATFPTPDKIANLRIAELKALLDDVEQAIRARRHELAALRGR